METKEQINFERIEKAIYFLQKNFKDQPRLSAIAEEVNLSPFHFHRLFSEWAGTSPKKFLQYLSVEHAKKLLKEQQLSLFDTAYETGLSGTSRLHDLFINIEGMTPAEYKNGGQYLSINYHLASSPFGQLLIASTSRGICFMVFEDDKTKAFNKLKAAFPNASFTPKQDVLQQNALSLFEKTLPLSTIKLHLKASDFQLKVWESLLKIPSGRLCSYGHIAQLIGKPAAARAVGTAIGSNPVAYLIPCHRVIQSSGETGQYRWGALRKKAIIGWECAQD